MYLFWVTNHVIYGAALVTLVTKKSEERLVLPDYVYLDLWDTSDRNHYKRERKTHLWEWIRETLNDTCE